MAWLAVYQELREHRKLYACADDLGVEPVTMLGMLVSLWLWSLDNVQDGVFNGISNRSIARAAKWPEKKADKLVSALISNGWIDKDEGSLSIHDWGEYTGRLMDKRAEEAERKRKKRAEKNKKSTGRSADDPDLSADCPQDVRRTSAGHPSDVLEVSADCPGNVRAYSNSNSNSTVPTLSVSPDGSTEREDILPGAEAAPGRSQTDDSPPAVITITLNDKTEYPISQQNVAEWESLYPSVDIMAELRKMRGWCIANPKKRKTKSGVMRFANAWLAKVQDGYHPKEGSNGSDAGRDEKAAAEYGICL